MREKKMFLQWLLFAIIISICLFITQKLHLFAYINDADITKLSFLIILLGIWMTLFAGHLARRLDAITYGKDMESKKKRTMKYIDRGLRHIDLAANISEKLGLLGTIAGFLFVFVRTKFQGATVENSSMLFTVIWQGASTALITTLVGIIASIILKFQYHVLDMALEESEEQ